MSQELARRCLWINRVFMQQTGKPEHETVGEKELQRRLAILQKDLKVSFDSKYKKINYQLHNHYLRIIQCRSFCGYSLSS